MDEDRIRFGDGSFAPEDDSLLRQPVDEGVEDPDTELDIEPDVEPDVEPDMERLGRPSDPAQGPDDEDHFNR